MFDPHNWPVYKWEEEQTWKKPHFYKQQRILGPIDDKRRRLFFLLSSSFQDRTIGRIIMVGGRLKGIAGGPQPFPYWPEGKPFFSPQARVVGRRVQRR